MNNNSTLCAGLCCSKEDDYNGLYYTVQNDALLYVEDTITPLNLGGMFYFETMISFIVN